VERYVVVPIQSGVLPLTQVNIRMLQCSLESSVLHPVFRGGDLLLAYEQEREREGSACAFAFPSRTHTRARTRASSLVSLRHEANAAASFRKRVGSADVLAYGESGTFSRSCGVDGIRSTMLGLIWGSLQVIVDDLLLAPEALVQRLSQKLVFLLARGRGRGLYAC